MDTREQLLKQLESLEERISEIKVRLPAHSAKPGMMMELMDLEDERDRLLSRLGENKNSE